jgi:glyoxylase-like metal-dependent hydrolase (beta-lactamase superfamily II)/rhodanese-related sulfurtransferase
MRDGFEGSGGSMYFRQFYLGCLAQASYMIGSDGEAAVVDPRRDVDVYLEEARAQGLTIRHVIETHLHADFVSGHRELAERTGARIYFGARAGAKFEHVTVHDGYTVTMGRVTLRFLETPGHTPESISVLVYDREGGTGDTPEAVLTGDTMFIGDVGRPDLLGAKISPDELAGQLYDSLHGKLLTLPDSVRVYPAHGAGSLCGRNISSETSSTIGEQRRFNYALRPMPREEFVALVTTDLPEAPEYFARDVQLNREGPGALEELPAPPALPPERVVALRDGGAIVLDTRPTAEFGAGHVPGAMHIGQSGQLASWAGALLSPQRPLVVVAEDEEHVAETRTRLARVGLENVAGYLAGGIRAWDESGRPLARTEQIDVNELHERLAEDRALQLIDVRRPAEWQAGHVGNAVHVPLHRLEELAGSLDPERPVAVICRSGYRSSIATSLLERKGFRNLTNVVGGMDAWTGAQFQTVTREKGKTG